MRLTRGVATCRIMELCKLPWVDKLAAYLSVKLVKNVFEVVTLDRLLRVEKIEELLDELRCNKDLELLDLNRFVNHELQEELVDALQVGPGGVHFFLLIDTGLSEVQIAFLYTGQRTENVLLNHLHDLIDVGENDADNIFLVCEQLLDLLDGVETLRLEDAKERFESTVRVGSHSCCLLLTLALTSLDSSFQS